MKSPHLFPNHPRTTTRTAAGQPSAAVQPPPYLTGACYIGRAQPIWARADADTADARRRTSSGQARRGVSAWRPHGGMASSGRAPARSGLASFGQAERGVAAWWRGKLGAALGEV
jgi:hypothetical protein